MTPEQTAEYLRWLDTLSPSQLLAYCAWMEDRGEGIGQCYNIMHVVMNRIRSKDFPNTIHDVVFQKNAFSWTRTDDAEYGLQPKELDPVWIDAQFDANYVFKGIDDDPTKGSLYYANLATITKGGWFERNIVEKPQEHPLKIKILKHSFFA